MPGKSRSNEEIIHALHQVEGGASASFLEIVMTATQEISDASFATSQGS